MRMVLSWLQDRQQAGSRRGSIQSVRVCVSEVIAGKHKGRRVGGGIRGVAVVNQNMWNKRKEKGGRKFRGGNWLWCEAGELVTRYEGDKR